MLKIIPSAQTVLPSIIDEGYVFIDKTRFIRIYEESGLKTALFLRPRRFGKTMFTEILKYYYDAALEEQGNRILKNTYIASHPTTRKNSYYVLKFDFSGITSNSGVNEIIDSFNSKVVNGISDFFLRYPDLVPQMISDSMSDRSRSNMYEYLSEYYGDKSKFHTCGIMIDKFLHHLKGLPRKVMIIIDEYDNFTNDVLVRDVTTFAKIARKEGEVSKFYQNLRACQQDNIVDRIYITGVLPITLDTSLSGFVYDNITASPDFNEMAGFSDDDVDELLKETVDFSQCRLFSADDLKSEMKSRYNGYRFSKFAINTVYNSSLCLSFIRKLIESKYEEIPSLQTESNSDMDFEKFSAFLDLIREPDRSAIISFLDADQDDGDCDRGYLSVKNLSGSLKVTSEDCRLNLIDGITLLYHLGFLTMMSKDEARNRISDCKDSMIYLKVPNRYYRNLFSQYMLSRYPVLYSAVRTDNWGISRLSSVNDISGLSKMLESLAGAFVKTSDSGEGESQIVLTVYVALCMLAENSFRLTREYSVRHNNSYVFSDGLEESEYGCIDENAVEKELINSGVIAETAASDSDNSANSVLLKDSENQQLCAEATLSQKISGGFRSRFRNDKSTATVNVRRGRADLVAENTEGGPSYIFEFKYHRDTNAREETKDRVCEILYNRAVKQLNFYVTDDRLSRIPDLHRYVIMYAYGEFYIEEIV